MRPDRRSPPSAFGRASPCSRSRVRQRLTLAALTPNRSAASRWVAPHEPTPEPEPEDQARELSTCLPASDPADTLNQNRRGMGIPADSFSSGFALGPRY